jgi:hypothetical protein
LRQAGVPASFIERVFYAIFSNLHIKDMFFTNKINFGNLGNFVTVGDTNCHFSQVKLQLKVNCPEIWQITENTLVSKMDYSLGFRDIRY